MSWDDLEERNTEHTEEHRQRAQQHQEALRKSAQSALNGEHAGYLVSYMQQKVKMISYRPGRSAEDVAYIEGYRAAMQEVLQLGGKL